MSMLLIELKLILRGLIYAQNSSKTEFATLQRKKPKLKIWPFPLLV